jgi:hypothetical protein
MSFEDRELADVFRNEDHPDWQSACERIAQILKSFLSQGIRWPRLRGLTNPDISEVVNDFWVYLKDERPRACSADMIDGAGAVRAEARRFLNSKPGGSVSIEAAEPNLKEHLRKKLKSVLRQNGFQQLKLNWWRVAGARDTPADKEDLKRAREKQPSLRAIWKPQNPAQDPPIAREDDLAAHANILLEIIGASCHNIDLRDLCWHALSPSFAQAMAEGITSDPTAPTATSEPRRNDQESDVLDDSSEAERRGRRDEFVDYLLAPYLLIYFEKLDPQRRSILHLTYVENLSLREVGGLVGLSKNGVSNRLTTMKAELKELFADRGYEEKFDRDVWRSLLTLMRDILKSWSFPLERSASELEP